MATPKHPIGMMKQADLQCPKNSTEACPLDELTPVRPTTPQAQQPEVGLQMGGGVYHHQRQATLGHGWRQKDQAQTPMPSGVCSVPFRMTDIISHHCDIP